MPRELLILRHAKSDWDTSAESDFERPLTRRGKRDASKIGAWLYREGLVPDCAISSPAQRARQTAMEVFNALDIDGERIVWDTDIYEASLAALLDLLGRCPQQSQMVLLVGHNPGLEDLAQYLSGDDLNAPQDGKLLPTGALARLEMPEGWDQLGPGCGKLISITRPRSLPPAIETLRDLG